jgi:aspartyl-tRNA(Asn)/glutamyl-tRNA(Gln) amidotransferase subunit A
VKAQEIVYAGVRELSTAYRSGTLSPVAVVEAHLERIARLDGQLKAYITVIAEEAREQAKEAERELQQGHDRGPLHGIPLAVKDQVMTKGLRTTAGSLILKDWIPREDATVIARLKHAGGILLGKLNMMEFALGSPLQYPFGTPRNPWNLDYETGGSSNGAGSAPAAGMATATIGEDTGGSVRNPAAYCGIAGLRPTWGLVSRYGMVPAVWQADTLGPMARTVEDVAYVLEVIAGADPQDPTTSQRFLPRYSEAIRREVRGLKAAVVRELLPGPGLDPEVEQGVRQAIAVLEGLGMTIADVSLPIVEHAGLIYIAFGEPEAAVSHLPFLRAYPAQYGYTARVRMATGLLVPGAIARWADRVGRRKVREEILHALDAFDILLTPTCRTPAPRLRERISLGYTSKTDVLQEFGLDRAYGMAFALAGVPALAVPCGFTRTGLPLSMQVIAKSWRDDLVLQVGHAYQQATNWHTQEPPLPNTNVADTRRLAR